MTDDPYHCPKCGSRKVAVQNFRQTVTEVQSLGDPVRFQGSNPSYDAICHDCGLRAHVEAYPPGMEPAP
jgi:transcription elongation factor Elf1